MKTTVSLYDFREAFRKSGRENFSYAGLEVLFDYLEAYEDDTGEELELDVIALCCNYCEEDSPANIAENYSIDLTDCDDEDDIKQAVIDYLNENTSIVGETDSSIIYQSF
jgi:hypothetical protein